MIPNELYTSVERERSNTVIASIDIVNKTFDDDPEPVHVISGVRFNVRHREFVGVLGPSGCGKTSLLRLIAGLDLNYEGSVMVNGRSVKGPGTDRGLMFQESRLFPWFTALQNVSFALTRGMARKEAREIAKTALDRVGLAEVANAWPHQLSGGMLKRIALARAIVIVPQILLLDEPLANLDEPAKYSLQDEIAHIHAYGKETFLLVTHDVDEAVFLSDRIVILSPKPSRVLTEIEVKLDRPRDRASSSFQRVCHEVSRIIFSHWRKKLI